MIIRIDTIQTNNQTQEPMLKLNHRKTQTKLSEKLVVTMKKPTMPTSQVKIKT
jgi:hypothetical protein